MIDKKGAVILALLILLLITSVGWFQAELKSEPTYPKEMENQMWIFHGYEAYLDEEIFSSVVKGTSMEPTFGENDEVLWVEVEPSQLEIGDIIIYNHPSRPGEGLIAHRIIKITKDDGYRFETKGDHRLRSDAHTEVSSYHVGEEDLRGLVIGVIYSGNTEMSPTTEWSRIDSLGGTISTPSVHRWRLVESWRL